MDFYGYKDVWGEPQGAVAEKRLDCFGRTWNLGVGESPSIITKSSILFDTQVIRQMHQDNLKVNNDYRISPVGDIWGHNFMADNATSRLIQQDVEVPISPLYARDLCGRIIYLGIGPHNKTQEEWGSDPSITFPRFCKDVDSSILGHDLIEQVFFTKFRCLDMSIELIGRPTIATNRIVAGYYRRANLYPYKVRLDTYYIDGWKLPQMEVVFARSEDISIQQAETLATELLEAWQKRPHNQSYEEFYEAIGGAAYFDGLFAKGCTLIPTFEAYNGLNKLNRQFGLEDFWPGRAVAGLHEVIQRKADSAPEGTILAVLQPGMVMGHRVHPAKVIVSDGTGYISPHHTDPEPLLPDVRLPHTRSTGKWHQCWLPTHPKHFERPAIWGWDAKTGIFMQLKGPLWDPLHYFYASVDEVLKAYKQQPLVGNKWLIPVPQKMKNRFYPIVPMRGFDTLNTTFREAMEEKLIRPFTNCMRFDDGKYSCNIGYHPLPVQYEYELDNWWFPELDPRQRATVDVPLDVEGRLCPVIECTVTPEAYASAVIAKPEARWMTDKELLQPSIGNSLEDYPGLKRYIGSFSEKAMRENALIHLEGPDSDEMDIPARELAMRFYPPEAIEEKFPGYAQALVELADEAAKRYQFRHQSYRQDPEGYVRDWWLGTAPIPRPINMQPQSVYKIAGPTTPSTSNPLPTTQEQVRPRGLSATSLKGPVVIE